MSDQTDNKGLLDNSELAQHVPDDWWKSLFDEWYLKTDGDVVENDEITKREVKLFRRAAGLRKDMKILDLCCGQGRHSLELVRCGFTQVTGYDFSPHLIATARQRAKERGVADRVTFDQGDARKLPYETGQFEAVVCLGNSFGYFADPADDEQVLAEVCRVLKPGGVFLLELSDGEYLRNNYTPYSWEWIGPDLFVCRQRSLTDNDTMLVSREIITATATGVVRDQFYQERLYTGTQAAARLEKTGLLGVKQCDVITADSDDHPDAGMMSRRLLLKAYGGLQLSETRFPMKQVTVVLGDPRRPSSEKLNAAWNEEDHEVRDLLKEALDRIPNVKFSYLDNHDTLLDDLRQTRPQFVFNLCDEGFKNDAKLELHVPAMLDMLAIPYTGCRPEPLAVCFDKALVRIIAQSLGVPTPQEAVWRPGPGRPTVKELIQRHALALPIFVKPSMADGSVGITVDSVCRTVADVEAMVERLVEQLPPQALLLQEFLTGPEYSTGLLGEESGPTWHCLPPLEVDYTGLPEGLPHIMGYESKWEPDSPYWSKLDYHVPKITAPIQAMIDQSQALADRLSLRDYCRFDWRADSSGVIKLLEVFIFFE